MADNKCFVCGKQIEGGSEQQYGMCDQCRANLAATEDKRAKMERLLSGKKGSDSQSNFRYLSDQYTLALKADPQNAGAYWGRMLCRFGVEYVCDPVKKEYHPVFYRVSHKSMTEDSDYLAAVQNAKTDEERASYVNEAAHLEKIRKSIRENKNEIKADVFITCCADENGNNAANEEIAHKLKDALEGMNLSVFYAGDRDEKYDSDAMEEMAYLTMKKARLMIVVVTQNTDFDAWPCRGEWRPFYAFTQDDGSKTMLICCRDITAAAVPVELQNTQMINVNHLDFSRKFTAAVTEAFGKVATADTEKLFELRPEDADVINESANVQKPIFTLPKRNVKEEVKEVTTTANPQEDKPQAYQAPVIEKPSKASPAASAVTQQTTVPFINEVPISQPQYANDTNGTVIDPNDLTASMYANLSTGNINGAMSCIEMLIQKDRFNCDAYIGKVMIKRGLNSVDQLGEGETPLAGDADYEKALRYANKTQKQTLIEYDHRITRRLMQKEQRENRHIVVDAPSTRRRETSVQSAAAEKNVKSVAAKKADNKPSGKPDKAKQKQKTQKAGKAPVQQNKPDTDSEQNSKGKSTGVKVLLGVAAAMVVAGGVAVYVMGNGSNPAKTLEQARELRESGEYTQAITLLSGIDNLTDEAEQELRLCRYHEALTLREEGDKAGAATILEELGTYQDAANLAAQLRADILYENGNLKAAYEAYSNLPEAYRTHAADYELMIADADAKLQSGDADGALLAYNALDYLPGIQEKIIETTYQKGEKLIIADDLSGAKACFEMISTDARAIERLSAINAYESAKALMDEGKTKEACEAFTALGDFADSAAKAESCYATLYAKAEEVWQSGDVQAAYDAFEAISSYSDAGDRASAIAAAYASAGVMVEADDLDGAIEAYAALGNFKDAAEKVKEYRLARASKAVSDGQFEKAENDYQWLSDYMDVSAELLNLRTAVADAAYNSGEYQKALVYYMQLQQTQDIKAREKQAADTCLQNGLYESALQAYTLLDDLDGCNKANYAIACAKLAAGEITEAKAMFEALPGIEDQANKLKECDYQLALMAEANAEYETAMKAFDTLGDYADSASRQISCTIKLADQYLAAGDPDKAMTLYITLADQSAVEAQMKQCYLAKANTLFEQKEYAAALSMAALVDSEEASKLSDQCNYNLLTEALSTGDIEAAIAYDQMIKDKALRENGLILTAEAKINNGSYSEAIDMLLGCETEDAKVKLTAIEAKLEEEARWEEALITAAAINSSEEKLISLAAKADEEAVRDLTAGMDNVSWDTISTIYEENQTAIHYQKAKELLEIGKIESARAIFRELKDYSDSATMVTECDYQIAKEMIVSGDKDEAYRILTSLGEYKDAVQLIEDDDYMAALAEKDRENGPYKTVGSVVTFGNFKQSGERDAAMEPINWIVLAVDGDKALLISEKALTAMQFSEKNVETTWENSRIRTYLNNEFYQTAFTDAEKAAITDTELLNNGNVVVDKMFLLSVDEAKTYFADSDARICAVTDAVDDKDLYRESNIVWWWLRSNGGDHKQAAKVSINGNIDRTGSKLTTVCGIRPAFWLDVDCLPKLGE